MSLKTFTRKANALRAARKFRLSSIVVRAMPGGFGFDLDMPEAAKGTVTAVELAATFHCTTRQVQKLAQRGIAVRVGRNKYDEARSITSYIVHLREQALARVGDEDFDVMAANARWKVAATALMEKRIENEALQLVRADEAREGWRRLECMVRHLVLEFPERFVAAIPAITPHDRDVIERICHDGLNDVALERGYEISSQSSTERD